MRIDNLIRDFANKGIKVRLKNPSTLEVEGCPSESDIEALKANKRDIITFLSQSANKNAAADWDTLRILGAFLGKKVDTGEPWGEGVLWGLSPYGASVLFEPCIVTFELGEVKPYSR